MHLETFNAYSKVSSLTALVISVQVLYKFFLYLGVISFTWFGGHVVAAEEYQYDEDTKYRVSKNSLGFNLEINYSQYQFIPSRQKLTSTCIEKIFLIANQISKNEDIAIQPIIKNNIQASFSRNELTGTSRCKLLVAVQWQQELMSF